MAGVMVVYGPPITHLPPPAVGASPDAAIHDFKGSCRRSVRITVGRSLPCQRRVPGEADFLKRSYGFKRGTPRACNLLNGKLSPQTSSFLKRS